MWMAIIIFYGSTKKNLKKLVAEVFCLPGESFFVALFNVPVFTLTALMYICLSVSLPCEWCGLIKGHIE